MGIASAPDWRGPYTRIGSGPILPKVMAEDPSLWVDKRGNFHYLMHYIPDATLVARHAFATHYDGPWMIHEESIPYNSTVQFTDGGETTWEKRERPHLVFNDQKDPAWLVTGAVLPGAAGGYERLNQTQAQGNNERAVPRGRRKARRCFGCKKRQQEERKKWREKNKEYMK